MAATFFYGRHQGWLHCGLTVRDASVLHSVAGWHDGLAELIRAVIALFGRSTEGTAAFQEEPGEFRWRITRLTSNRVRVRVVQFNDWAQDWPDTKGKLLFDQPCGLMALATAIFAGTDDPSALLSGVEVQARAELGTLLGSFRHARPDPLP